MMQARFSTKRKLFDSKNCYTAILKARRANSLDLSNQTGLLLALEKDRMVEKQIKSNP
jgi:hypothetical protein